MQTQQDEIDSESNDLYQFQNLLQTPHKQENSISSAGILTQAMKKDVEEDDSPLQEIDEFELNEKAI